MPAVRETVEHVKEIDVDKYKYGFEVARDYDDAVRLDELHGNRRWQDATGLEMKQLDDYQTFNDYGHKDNAKIPVG